MNWEKDMENLKEAMVRLGIYEVEFIDEKLFPKFLASLGIGGYETRYRTYVQAFKFLDITGYFSEGISDELCRRATKKTSCKIRLISPSLNPKNPQDKNNLIALRKMQDKGIEIKVNPRMHARIFVGYHSSEEIHLGSGVLLLGSFDFNREGLSGEKRNAGIITRHPDLVKSARNFFERIWEDKRETTPLDENYPP